MDLIRPQASFRNRTFTAAPSQAELEAEAAEVEKLEDDEDGAIEFNEQFNLTKIRVWKDSYIKFDELRSVWKAVFEVVEKGDRRRSKILKRLTPGLHVDPSYDLTDKDPAFQYLLQASHIREEIKHMLDVTAGFYNELKDLTVSFSFIATPLSESERSKGKLADLFRSGSQNEDSNSQSLLSSSSQPQASYGAMLKRDPSSSPEPSQDEKHASNHDAPKDQNDLLCLASRFTLKGTRETIPIDAEEMADPCEFFTKEFSRSLRCFLDALSTAVQQYDILLLQMKHMSSRDLELGDSMSRLQHESNSMGSRSSLSQKDSVPRPPAQDNPRQQRMAIRSGLMEVYRQLRLLQNFAEMNFMALFHILGYIETRAQRHLDYELLAELKLGRQHMASSVSSLDNKVMNMESTRALDDWVRVCKKEFASLAGIAPVATVIEHLERTFADIFCDGSMINAKSQLLVSRGKDDVFYSLELWHIFTLGLRIGIMLVFFLWLIWDSIVGVKEFGPGPESHTNQIRYAPLYSTGAFRLFRGIGAFLLAVWCWVGSCAIWDRNHVNYRFILQLQPKTTMSPIEILSDIINTTIVFLVSFILYYKTILGHFPVVFQPEFYPAMLFGLFVFKLVYPPEYMTPLWKTAGRISLGFLFPISFFDSFVADWFTSIVKPVNDLLYGTCYVTEYLMDRTLSDDQVAKTCAISFFTKIEVVACISVLPLFFRFMQCLKQYYVRRTRFPPVYNSFKYALSMCTVLFGMFHRYDEDESIWYHVLWLALFEVNSLYSFCWDVYVDWQLGSFKHDFLRGNLMFPEKQAYYGVIFLDFFGRHLWLVSLLPSDTALSLFGNHPIIVLAPTFVLLIEVLRRSMWGIFRVENEHRSNSHMFRTYAYVPMRIDDAADHKQDNEKTIKHWYSDLPTLVELVVLFVCAIYICVTAIRFDPDPNN